MAGNLWGADVAQLRTLAQQFGKTSETLLQQSTTLTSAINGNTSWKGADGARFTSEWNGSHRALIQKTALALKAESKRLLTHAEQQEKASNAATGAGGGPGALGPGGNGSDGELGCSSAERCRRIGGLRAAMRIQKNLKAPLTLAKHVGQLRLGPEEPARGFHQVLRAGAAPDRRPGLRPAPPASATLPSTTCSRARRRRTAASPRSTRPPTSLR